MVRPFRIEDSKALCDMLMAEGLDKDQMAFLEGETWVYEDETVRAFYTFKIEHEFPHLQHFCVDRNNRGGNVARGLISHFKKRIKLFRRAIINSPANNDFVDRIIRRYFGVTKPYATDTEHKFYFVEIGGKYGD